MWIGNRESAETCRPFYEKSVESALKSRDLNLLYLCIKRITASYKLTEYEIFELFSKTIDGIYAMINYYKMFDRVALVRYYDHLQLQETKIIEFIRYALECRTYEEMERFLMAVSDLLNIFNTHLSYEWRKPTFKRLLTNFQQFLKHNPTVKSTSDKIKPVALGRQLEAFMAKGLGSAVDDFKVEYDVPSKRIILTQIKTLIDQRKFDELMMFYEKRHKDFKIPAELVADLLLERGESTWAMKMISKMPNKKKKEQYQLLQRVGKYKEAIDLAHERKD